MNKRGTTFLILVMIIVFLMGCTDTKANNDKTKYSNKEIQQLNDKIKEYETKLNVNEEKIKELENSLNMWEQNYEICAFSNIREQYPWILNFQNNKQYDKIVAYLKDNPYEKVSIDDKKMIEAIAQNFCIIRDATGDYPNGISKLNDVYVYELYFGENKLVVNVFNDETIQFENLPMKYFQVKKGIDRLGRSMLKKDNYLKNDLLKKMAESGLISGEKEYPYYSLSRMDLIAYGFDRMQKKQIKKPEVSNEQRIEHLTFYYYGEKIYMDIYKSYIHIFNNNTDYWYLLSNNDCKSLLNYLSAN